MANIDHSENVTLNIPGVDLNTSGGIREGSYNPVVTRSDLK